MAKPKIKIMKAAVSFGSVRQHMLVEEYCQREFGKDMLTQLTHVCEDWLEKALMTVLQENGIRRAEEVPDDKLPKV